MRNITSSLTLPCGTHFHATLGTLRRSWLLLLLFLVMITGLSAQQIRIPDLLAEDLYYSKAKNILYATIREDSPRYSNSVALINPLSGHVISSIPVGSQPGIMAASDDGQFLYVVLNGSTSVRRIRLSSRTAEDEFPISLEIPIEIAGPEERRRTVAMKVVRGEPNTIVVAQRKTHGYHIGIAVYKEGKKLPDVLGRETGCNNLALGGDPQTIWCFDDDSDFFSVQKLRIGPTGISREHVGPGRFLDCCFNGRLEYHDGLLYTSDGMVFDPESLRIQGQFSSPVIDVPSGGFAIDKDAGRIYFGRRYSYLTEIWEHDITTFRPTASFANSEENPGTGGGPNPLVRCGPGGLAAIDEFYHHINIFKLDLLEPFEPIVPSQPTWLDNGIRYISLPNTEIAYEPNSNRIFAAVPNVPGIGNSVVPIDASSLSVGEPIWIGSVPYQMAISGDGRYLYQSLWWANYMQRLDLTTLTPDFSFSLSTSFEEAGNLGVSSLLVLPDSNETLAIARELDNLTIYDRGVARPEVVTSEHSPNSIIQLDSTGTRLYSLNTETSNFELATNVITPEGVYRIPRAPGWIKAGGFYTNMKCQMDVCFTTHGEVVDPIQKKHLGRCSVPIPRTPLTSDVLPDIHNRRVYYLLITNRGVKLESCELDTFSKAETLSIEGVRRSALKLIQTRSDEFAFSTGAEIGIIPKSALSTIFQINAVGSAVAVGRMPVAPGMMITIYGHGLAKAQEFASSLPLPDELSGVRVTINERAVPLLSVSPNQITALVPFDTQESRADLVVTMDGAETNSVKLAVSPTAPGILLHVNSRHAIALNEDDTLNSESEPALPGERIVVYFIGQGAVTPEIGDGHPTPTDNLIMTKATTEATIGSKHAKVEFSGLVGGFVGLAQAILVVPDIDAGDHQMTLTVGGMQSNWAFIEIGEDR